MKPNSSPKVKKKKKKTNWLTQEKHLPTGGVEGGKRKKKKKVKGTVWHLPMNGDGTCVIALQYAATHVNEK